MVGESGQGQLKATGWRRSNKLRCGELFAEDGRARTEKCQREEKEPPSLMNNELNLVALLKTCAERRDLYEGIELHNVVLGKGLLQSNLFIGNALVNLYAKCGCLAKAEHVLEALPVRDAVSWNALLSGYAQHGLGKEALNLFERMQHEGILPNAVTFACLLKGCGSIQAVEKGEELHSKIERIGYLHHGNILGNALLNMYAKCGEFGTAIRLFNQLLVRNVVTWTTLISGYCQHGHIEDAFNCFGKMRSEGLLPSAATFASVLKACGSMQAADLGIEIHSDIARIGWLGPGSALVHSLVDMYAKCGALAKAHEMLDLLPMRDVFVWTALIGGYSQCGYAEKVFASFEQMKHEGISPSATTLTCVLTCCGNTKSADKGKEIHADSIKGGFLDADSVLGNALVDMYAKCGALRDAQAVFKRLSSLDVASWSALIGGYSQQERVEEAMHFLEEMKYKGLIPDAVTYSAVLQACGSVEAINEGIELHSEIARRELMASNIILGSSLVDFYAKCGLLAKAKEVFDMLPAQNLVCWGVLISGYCNKGSGKEAFEFLDQMKGCRMIPDAVVLSSILKACAITGAIEKGVEIHTEIERRGLLGTDTVLSSALVDMYAKCGLLTKSREVFDKLPARDVVSWSVIITGYYENGFAKKALILFEQMLTEGVNPDEVTFACILDACCGIGACTNGQMYFEAMSKSFGIVPTLMHYTCMAVLYSRSGQLDKSIAIIRKMPSPWYTPAWRSLLAACQKWGNLMLGRLAFNCAFKQDDQLFIMDTSSKGRVIDKLIGQ